MIRGCFYCSVYVQQSTGGNGEPMGLTSGAGSAAGGSMSVSGGSGGTGLGGSVSIASGYRTDTSSGSLTVETANAGTYGVSGAMTLSTGDATTVTVVQYQ